MKIEAYCVKCKAPREMSDAKLVTMKNGRSAARGSCAFCGGSMYKILSRECEKEFEREQPPSAEGGPVSS